MSKMEELKKLREQKKAMREQEKALREELDAGKEERKAAKKTQAQARKDVKDHKAELSKATAAIYKTFSDGSSEEIAALADKVMESATELSGVVRSFAEASEQLEEL